MQIPTKLVVAGILWRGHEFLAAQRPEGKAHAGYWEFPGGKVEAGESLEEALVRELQEELDVTPLTMKAWQVVRHVYNDSASLKEEEKKVEEKQKGATALKSAPFAVEVHFYHVTAFEGDVVAKEGHGLAWMTRDMAVTYPFLEADRPLVATLPLEQPE
ncbi:MAG: (deoxy)nucleoside triphosphate pyrophosphohydrolase [Pseudomonadota bacterium]